REKRRAAVRAEALCALVAALRGLHVDARLAAQQLEAAAHARHVDPVGGAGAGLAIGAVAYRHLLRVDLGFVGDLAAMACAVDFHVAPSSSLIGTRRPQGARSV